MLAASSAFGQFIRIPPDRTVSELATCAAGPVAGLIASVSDATSATVLGAGGGSVTVLVQCRNDGIGSYAWEIVGGTAGGAAQTAVSKNSGATVGTRGVLNVIEGANVTLTVTDDAGGDEIDVVIAASAGGSPGTDSIGLTELDDDTATPVDGQVLLADATNDGIDYGDLVPANADCDETDDTLCVGNGTEMRGEVLVEGPNYWDADGNAFAKETHCDSQTIQSLAGTDDNLLIWGGSIYTVDITRLWAHCRGTCTTTTGITVADGDGNAITHGTITAATTGAATAVTPSGANTLSAFEGLEISVGTISPDGSDDYTVGWCWEVTDAN